MKIKFFISILFTLFTCFLFGQQTIQHKVEKGDTVYNLASKYNVPQQEIYRLNPSATKGVSIGDVLLIPNIKNTTTEKVVLQNDSKPYVVAKSHVVLPKETLFSISKVYNVTVADLQDVNKEALNEGLKIGQTIKIPSKVGTMTTTTVVTTTETTSKNVITHVVEEKETKYGIAKKYGITIDQLEKENPEAIDKFTIGLTLKITADGTYKDTNNVQPAIVKTTSLDNRFANYEVKEGETIYSISQSLSIPQEQLVALNQYIKDGLEKGMILKVPGKGSLVKIPATNSKLKDLTKAIVNSSKKHIAMLLPFNSSKIKIDSLKTVETRIRDDVFLGITLDFYSGALMAIDSAKTLGANVDVSFYDSEENKTNSNIEKLLKDKKIKESNAIIGPFYQQYVNQVATILKDKNIPVISPLSKEQGNKITNTYQSLPSIENAKVALMEHMIAKNGNIIYVGDTSSKSNRDFVAMNYPLVVFSKVSDNGSLDMTNFKSLFIKDRINYVIIDTEKMGLILSTTNAMLNQKSNFQTQLVLLEPNELMESDEVSIKRLTILKLLYASVYRESDEEQITKFENAYKKINKTLPNQFAKRGFDVTFDTILRVSQGISFEESINKDVTEHIDNKFQYYKSETGGYINKGVFIFEYQDDLSIKLLN